ncbi:MAG: metallophosphoesterase [Verrucomicrobiota bacterium]
MMSTPGFYSRRRFLGTLAVGGAAWMLGLPRRAAWAAKGSATGALRLAFFADVHARTEWDTPKALARAAAAINAQKPDLVIGGGDCITEGFESSAATVEPRWQVYLDMHKAIEAPIYPAIGNHDLVAVRPKDGTPPSADPRAIFREKLGVDRTYRSFDAAGYHFILLDSIQITNDKFEYHGLIGPEQMEWLKEDLAGFPASVPTVVVSHMPFLTAFYEAVEGATAAAPVNRVLTNSKDVLRLFEGRNLLLGLQGHLHVSEMLRWRDATFVTGGAISGQWWRGAWQGTEEGFAMITLRGDRVEWEYVDYGWDARRPPGK